MLTNIPEQQVEAALVNKMSVSELGTLMRCKKKYDYSYIQRITPVSTPGYLSKGKYLHMMMEDFLSSFAKGEDIRDVAVLSGRALERLRDQRLAGDNSAVLAEVDKQQIDSVFGPYLRGLDMAEVEVVGTETEFLADIGLKNFEGNIVPIHGFIDAILRANGELWLVEHKTASRAWSQGNFDFAYQGRVYPICYEALTGEKPVGITYNFFLPKRVDQNFIYVPDQDAEAIYAELEQAVQLRDLHLTIREPHWGCTDCWFRDLCVAELYGNGAEALRATAYKSRDEEVEEVEA